MAFVDNTTYTGKDAQGFYAKALLTGETKKMFKPYLNVKSKIKIARYDETGVLQEADCTFSDAGTGTFSQKTLTVCPLKVNREFCVTTFEANYLSEQLKAGANGEEVMPTSFEDFMLAQIAANVSKDLESLIWQGDVDASPTPGLCDGLLKKFVADATVIDVAGTTLSAANIFAELAKVYAVIPETILENPDLVIFISPAAARFYRTAIATINPLGGTFNTGDYRLMYLNVNLVISRGLTANQMVAAVVGTNGNLWFGTDLMSDFDDVTIIPQHKISGAPTVRFVARFQFGVEYGVGEEIVYYRP